jgi:hypothetical protein
MAKNNNSDNGPIFWLKSIVIGAVVLSALYFLLFRTLPNMDVKETTNAAAKGLSNFYESIKNRADNRDNDRAEYVLEIEKPKFPAKDALAQRGLKVKPSEKNWKGKEESRRFKAGDTLKNILSQFARKEGIELMWYLDKDYKVKESFRVDSTFLKALYQVGTAINDDFEFEVYTFYCHKQKAAIITENPSQFVRENCQKVTR